MRIAMTSWLVLGLAAVPVDKVSANVDTTGSLVAATARYEFHSNAWLNLHHYLFRLAKDHPESALSGVLLAHGLSAEDAASFSEAAAFYRAQLRDRSLLFDDDLFAVKRLLIAIGGSDEPELEGYPQLGTQLRRVFPVYAKHVWPAHSRQNERVLEEHLDLILKLEDQIFERIAELSENQWPKHKVRVDLSYVANWAGAYTTVRPITHAVIQTSGWEAPHDWFEILFHEPTHAMIGPDDGAVAEHISRSAERLGRRPPNGLWHGILFYVAGTAVQESLAEEGVSYEMFMFRNGTFRKFHRALRRHMPDYVTGEITLERAIENILSDES